MTMHKLGKISQWYFPSMQNKVQGNICITAHQNFDNERVKKGDLTANIASSLLFKT